MSDKITIEELKNKISENIKKLSINVSQLAQMADVSNLEMLNIVHGNALPSIDTLRN